MNRHSLTRINVIALYKQLHENRIYTHFNNNKNNRKYITLPQRQPPSKLYICIHNRSYTSYGSILTQAL